MTQDNKQLQIDLEAVEYSKASLEKDYSTVVNKYRAAELKIEKMTDEYDTLRSMKEVIAK
jgi:hypothetical protein